MKYFIFISLCSLVMSLFISCSEDDGEQTGSIDIEFDNVVGSADLVLDTEDEPYTNTVGETYKITALKYYISNIKLKTLDGAVYEDATTADGAKGYYLINEGDEETHLVTLENVPADDYTEITFTIGVDANQVSEGAQTGALDPAKGMFWSWNTGYIFVKLEGESSSSTDPDHYILYHVGGYKDPNNNIRPKTVSLGHEPASVRGNKTPEVHMIVDVNKFFESPNQISFGTSPVRHMPADNKVIADNYTNTFVADHVHN
jgi:hypothetical protein